MKEEIAKALREPFPTEDVGKLPRITCSQCRDSRTKNCDRHTKQKCHECGNWITTAHVHLDYVGHAELTDRLLSVDPEWNWEPLALDGNGVPFLDGNGGMWIRLTIGGTTRFGYGHADGKRGGDAIKETIGDALRNAAMRFGVALDLWRREPAHLDEHSEPEPPRESPTKSLRQQVADLCAEKGWDPQEATKYFVELYKTGTTQATEKQLSEFLDLVKANGLPSAQGAEG